MDPLPLARPPGETTLTGYLSARRLTKRFTKQANDLQSRALIPPFRACRAAPVQGPAKRLPRATARTRDASSLVVPNDGCHVLVPITAAGPAPGHRPRRCPAQAPSPNPTAAGPYGRRVLSRVGAADHAVTPQAPWTGSGWRAHSYGGFGGGHAPFHLHAFWPQPYLHNLYYQPGHLQRSGFHAVSPPDELSASDRERPLLTPVNGTTILRPGAGACVCSGPALAQW